MRLPRKVRRAAAALAASLVLASAWIASAGAWQAGSDRPSDTEMAAALEALNADPNLSDSRTIKMLRWRSTSVPRPRTSGIPAWLEWLIEAVRWMERSARALVWVAAAILAALLAVYLLRLVQAGRVGGSAAGRFIAPTHVRNLDIRPESLPANLGAAARALWDGGDHRAALSLLYRGALSRLAHVHRVPIRDSSTEGDCLALAAIHLMPQPRDYTGRLVQTWQRSVYGNESIGAPTVYGLCDEFAAALDAVHPAASLAGGAS